MSCLHRSFSEVTRISLDGVRWFFILLLINHLVRPLEAATKLPEWNDTDYQSNQDFYSRRRVEKRFEPEDHLRLDRISSARFHPVNGQSIIYLRDQHHLTNVKLSTTSLHWLDLETNRTKELTRPIWGKHDRQVKQSDSLPIFKTVEFSFSGSMKERFSFFPIDATPRQIKSISSIYRRISLRRTIFSIQSKSAIIP